MSISGVRSYFVQPLMVGVAVSAMLLGGCDMPDDPTGATPVSAQAAGMTPAEMDLRAKTEQQRKADSAIAGAAGGAVLGAITGYLWGGWQGAAIGAATGGVAGAALGVGYGSYMNAKAAKYSDAEARSTAVTKAADETLAYYDQVNTSARTILAEQEAKIAKLNDDYKGGAITKEQYRKQLASAGDNQANLSAQIKGLDKQLGEMKGDQQAASLTQQIGALQTKRDSLKETYDRLVQVYSTVPSEVQQGSPIVVSAK